jgi:hypothetical protein
MSLVLGYAARNARLSLTALLLAVFALLASGAASAQHTSVLCPAQTATVTSGGSVTINISACQQAGNGGIGPIDGGSFGAGDFENHGTATTRLESGGSQWFLDYSHNGSTGIGSTDVFELSDGSLAGNGDIRFTITINPSASPITVLPAALPTLTAGTPFSQTLTSSGGLAPYTYALQSGVLPIGLTLTSGGVLSGTPTQRGAYSFSVRSTDSTSPAPPPSRVRLSRWRSAPPAASRRTPICLKPAPSRPVSPFPAPAWSVAPLLPRPATIP